MFEAQKINMFSVSSMFEVISDEHLTNIKLLQKMQFSLKFHKLKVFNLLEKNYFQAFLVERVTNCVEIQVETWLISS